MALRAFILAAALAITVPFARADQALAVWANGRVGSISDEEMTRNAISSPPAPYPEEAQKRNLTGNGLYELRVAKDGKVSQVAIVKSAGNRVLDQAARSAFLKWRFKPGVFVKVQIPVSWSVNRVRS
jgi:TonB family protein